MGKGCLTASKYFLFIFNLVIFLLGAALLGFGLWLVLDNQSFVVVLNNAAGLKLAAYILLGVGAFSMLLSLLGCLGAVFEFRCLLSMYSTSLLVIVLKQIAVIVLLCHQKGTVHNELSKIISKVLDNYSGKNSSTEQAWDFIQRNMECCGWISHMDWNNNMVVINSSQLLFPCSCQNISLVVGNFSGSGFCEAQTPDWPAYDVGCAASVERWIRANIALVLGVSITVVLIELLGMIGSICLCRNLPRKVYTKVPKS